MVGVNDSIEIGLGLDPLDTNSNMTTFYLTIGTITVSGVVAFVIVVFLVMRRKSA